MLDFTASMEMGTEKAERNSTRNAALYLLQKPIFVAVELNRFNSDRGYRNQGEPLAHFI